VIEPFDDPTNLPRWQKGLQSFEAISGTPGQLGAKSRLVFDTNGRKMDVSETITVRNLPGEFSGPDEAPGVSNINKNFFCEVGPNQTRYVNEQESQFSGLMKVVGFFMRGTRKKQCMTCL
jgi:hypothetical protein